MSVRGDLQSLVRLQQRELEVVGIDEEIAAIERDRAAAKAGVAAARKAVAGAEKELEEARAEARRRELELKSAEDKVGKFKDHLLDVKTNEQLWALQEEIRHAEAAVGDVETKILEQLERADAIDSTIDERRRQTDEAGKRADAEIAAADRREAELEVAKEHAAEAIEELRGSISAKLLKKYDDVKHMRAGIGVAEALDEVCLVCNFRMRPQLYVEVSNLAAIQQCEHCKRILYIADRLDVGSGPQAAVGGGSTAPGADAGAAIGDRPDAPGPAGDAIGAPLGDDRGDVPSREPEGAAAGSRETGKTAAADTLADSGP